jgi:hypothetical protein
MYLRSSMVCQPSLEQEINPFAATVFPELDNRLTSEVELFCRENLPKTKLKQYRSLTDLFIVEANPILEMECIHFYYDSGPRLEDNPKWNGSVRLMLLERALVLLEITKESGKSCKKGWFRIVQSFDCEFAMRQKS